MNALQLMTQALPPGSLRELPQKLILPSLTGRASLSGLASLAGLPPLAGLACRRPGRL
ncbi:MAG: hypothetical protein JO345_31570 [Streptosporangiaceae bacterium]|nr:hypothetical protein [Streptosporangiaceae bacterium]